MRKQRTRAELELLMRRVPKAPRVAPDDSVKLGDAPSSVNGTHRSGKRRRGNSLTKLGARTQTRALTLVIRDADGIEVARVKTRTYKRETPAN